MKMRALMTLEPYGKLPWIARGAPFVPVSPQHRLDLLAAGRAEDVAPDEGVANKKPARGKAQANPE